MVRSLIVFCSFFVFSSALFALPTSCNEHHCIAVVDAGSTGSRAHLYAYDLDDTNTPIHITELWSNRIKPGLASIEANDDTINAYLNSLFINAPSHQAPVYFYATAGMRLLPAGKQKNIFQTLTQWFAKQSQWQLMDARTITGHEEALFDWISVNYHLGTIQLAKKNPIGVMDMGGASVQIVFPVRVVESADKLSRVALDLYGQHIELFVQSFLGLGQNEVLHQVLDATECFANDYPLPNGEEGHGNAPACAHELTELTNSVHRVSSAVQPTLRANPVQSWYAIGGISNYADNPLFHFEHNQLTNQEVMAQGDNQICHQSWDALNAKLPNDDYLYQYCLLSAYYYALMVDGYGLKPEQSIHYIPSNQNIDWTVGVVFHQQSI